MASGISRGFLTLCRFGLEMMPTAPVRYFVECERKSFGTPENIPPPRPRRPFNVLKCYTIHSPQEGHRGTRLVRARDNGTDVGEHTQDRRVTPHAKCR